MPSSSSIETPVGQWSSPITPALLAARTTTFDGVCVDEKTSCVYCVEVRPASNERTRSCIVRKYLHEEEWQDILSPPYNAHTSVHEYGGGVFTLDCAGDVIFSDQSTNGVFHLSASDSSPALVTPDLDERVRFADFHAHPTSAKWILAVMEDHRDQSNVINSIAALDTETRTTRTVVSGCDFYLHPRFSPTGDKVSWMEWNHPDMPWTGSVLFIADWDSENGSVTNRTSIAGKAAVESIAQPRWALDGSLMFLSDRTGYWQLYRYKSSKVQPIRLSGLEQVEFSGPEVWIGSCTYCSLTASTLVAAYTLNAANRLIVVDLQDYSAESGFAYKELNLPLVDIQREAIRRVSDTRFIVVGSTTKTPKGIYLVELTAENPGLSLLRSSLNLEISESWYSEPQHISYPRVYGDVEDCDGLAHAYFHLPKSNDFYPPARSLPPLIIVLHGGPVFHVAPGLSLETQYWTTRGYAVALVNFSGSTGYGRAYRDRLNAKWGVRDIIDIASCVDYLKSKALVDASRVFIRGRSGGGYSTLQAMCVYPALWAGGVSVCGLSDLKAFNNDTHKFESQFLFGLLWRPGATDEEKEEVYSQRSPCYHAANIGAALLLLQGREDKVVLPSQAEIMERSIKESGRGGKAKVVIYDGEGHSFAQGATIMDAIEQEEEWYRQLLLRE